MSGEDGNGWDEYRKLVMSELLALDSTLNGIMSELTQMRTDLAALKVKAGIWGLIGGALPAIVTIVILYIEARIRP